jgi:hypothetical protein
MVNGDAVYAKTLLYWKLTLAHAAKTLGHLKSALLLTLASAAMGLAWLCCWLEHFLSGRRSTAWLLPLRRDQEHVPISEHKPEAVPMLAKVQPFAMPHPSPRTIDGLLRTRNASARMEERGSSPMVH